MSLWQRFKNLFKRKSKYKFSIGHVNLSSNTANIKEQRLVYFSEEAVLSPKWGEFLGQSIICVDLEGRYIVDVIEEMKRRIEILETENDTLINERRNK